MLITATITKDIANNGLEIGHLLEGDVALPASSDLRDELPRFCDFFIVYVSATYRPTVWLSGGRLGGTRGVRQLYYRAASLRAAQAARPLEPVLGVFSFTYSASIRSSLNVTGLKPSVQQEIMISECPP